MYINNNLRDIVYKNNYEHGFWKKIRPYDEFAKNVLGEIEEAMAELMNHPPTEVYYKKGNKPEGAPTELADIIIFILDYFGGSEPPIDIDEEFLEAPDEFYKNPEYYSQIRNINPWEYFIEISDACRKQISMSIFYNAFHGNDSFVADNGETVSVPKALHLVIKYVLLFCDIYGIDMEKELINKINYNNSRPIGYRQIGEEDCLDTDPVEIGKEVRRRGWYGSLDPMVDEIMEYRSGENNLNKLRAERYKEAKKNIKIT